MFGRVRIYNAGFVVFTVASILLSFDPFRGGHGALVADRLARAAGARRLDADRQLGGDPDRRVPRRAARASRSGINQVAALAGQFIGLVAGGLLAAIDWRAVFWVNVPVGVFGTVWAYRKLRDNGERHPRPDRLVGQRHVRRRPRRAPDRHHQRHPARTAATRWAGRNPTVFGSLIGGGALLLVAFVVIESRVAEPMFAARACSGSAPSPPATSRASRVSIARGGLQFMLIIWLQGIWLPLHGYDYSQTPLWAGIFLLPLTAGFLVAGPISGLLSDRFGARGFATAGMLRVRRQLHRADAAAGRLPLLGVRAADRSQRDRRRHVRRAQLVRRS